MLSPWRLRLLVHLESLGTVRAVAESLNLSPSAVSQQLSVLEREAHVVLLEHHGRRVCLTPVGVRLAGHAREILQRIEAAEADLAELRTEPVGAVRVAAFTSALRALVIPAAVHLRHTHPRLQVVTVELEPRESLPALRRGDVDLALIGDFADGAFPVDDKSLRVPLTSDPLVMVLPLDHPAATAATLDLATMARERWAFDQHDSHLSGLVTRLCRQAGFEPDIAGRYASYDVLLQHVESGLTVTALPRLAVDQRYQVAARPLTPGVTRSILATVRTSPAPLPAVRAVLDQLRAEGAALSGGSDEDNDDLPVEKGRGEPQIHP